MESILTSTKKLAGLTKEYDYFDPDIIMYINNVFLSLKQLGVGPSEGFIITDENDTWIDFIPDNNILREATRAYMGSKVRLQFDPPTNSTLLKALQDNIKEYEFRLNLEAESSKNS
jgi:hypothetical protein